MKSSFSAIAVLVLLLIVQTQNTQAAPSPLAKVIRVTGEVLISGKAAIESTTIKTGEPIVTGIDGAVLIGLASGQHCFLGNSTEAVIEELSMDSKGTRSSIVKVTKGTANSDIHPPKTGSNSHTITTPLGKLKALGTAWSTTVGSNLVVVSYSGTVAYEFPGLGTFNLSPGAVATLSGAPSAPVLTIVDLITGRVYIHRPGATPEDRLASPRELASAAASFELGINAYLATATEAGQIALGQLIASVNQLLANNGVPAIGAGRSSLWPAAVTQGLSQLSGIASPDTPSTNQ